MKQLQLNAVKQRFDRVAKTYDDYALIAKDVAQRLLSRLQAIKIEPQHIVDLGCGTGVMTQLLESQYPDVKVTGIDLSQNMLNEFKKKHQWITHCTAASVLPFPDKTVDLVVSSLMLPWVENSEQVFKEVRRVLKDDAIFVYSTFGPDTFTEFRQAWAQVDNNAHVHIALDMHDIGDQMLHAGFKDPVMDVERVTLKYKSFVSMMEEIKKAGLTNLLKDQLPGLTSRQHFADFKKHYAENFANHLHLELVFSYAEGGGDKKEAPGEYTFSLDELKKTLHGHHK